MLISIGSHAHKAAKTYVFKAFSAEQNIQYFFVVKPLLGRLGGNVHFKQYIYYLAVLGAPFIDRLEQMEGIDRLDQ